MATRYDRPSMTTTAAERARVTSMLIVIGIIVLITSITSFIAGRLQSRGADLKLDIQSASALDAAAAADPSGDPARKIIVNTEERERLRIMKQMNDQLMLGVITGGIVTISILIVSMLIVNMGEAQRHHALERVEDLLPLPQMIPHRRGAAAAYDDDTPQSPVGLGTATPRRRINRNAANGPAKRTANAGTSPTRNAPLSEAELAERMSNGDFADKKLPEGLALGGGARGIGNLDDLPGGERDKFIASEAAKMVGTFYSVDVDKQAEREALQRELGGADALDMNTAKALARKKYGIQSNANMRAKRNAVFSGGMFGKVSGDGDDDSPTRLY